MGVVLPLNQKISELPQRGKDVVVEPKQNKTKNQFFPPLLGRVGRGGKKFAHYFCLPRPHCLNRLPSTKPPCGPDSLRCVRLRANPEKKGGRKGERGRRRPPPLQLPSSGRSHWPRSFTGLLGQPSRRRPRSPPPPPPVLDLPPSASLTLPKRATPRPPPPTTRRRKKRCTLVTPL